MFWHHNLFKQTRYWILKPQTHTHHHHPKTERVHWGYQFLFALFVLRRAVPADVYSTWLFRSAQLEVHLRFARIVPDQSDCCRSLRPGNLDNNTHIFGHLQNRSARAHSRTPKDPEISGERLRRTALRETYATGSASSGESLRTFPTALPTLCRVTLAGST